MTAVGAAASVAEACGAGRGLGRPRDDEMDGRILEAALSFIDAGEELTVSRLVERAGVSRAALYRRWPTLTDLLVAALDVGRTVPPGLPEELDLHQEFLMRFLGATEGRVDPDYPEARFRQRIRLMMADRELQRAYWESHVARRRVPVEDALRAGVARGELRSDLDVEAAMDLLAGVVYYQLVVRGEAINSEGSRARVRAAVDLVWRGMTAPAAPPAAASPPAASPSA